MSWNVAIPSSVDNFLGHHVQVSHLQLIKFVVERHAVLFHWPERHKVRASASRGNSDNQK